MSNVEAIKKDKHERIWLEPEEDADPYTGQMWCQDNQWGDKGVEYVLASTLESLQRENESLKKDRYDLAYAITGGEDAPGLLDTVPTPQLVEIARNTHRSHSADIDRADAAEAEVKRLAEKLASCDWYWPEGDTSSDACANSPWEIAETYDLKPADILAYSRGGVVETRYYAFLPPADDSDSDDNFEVDEPTEEAVAAKITAEIERRQALASAGEHHAE